VTPYGVPAETGSAKADHGDDEPSEKTIKGKT
jgi:hypothetical protein